MNSIVIISFLILIIFNYSYSIQLGTNDYIFDLLIKLTTYADNNVEKSIVDKYILGNSTCLNKLINSLSDQSIYNIINFSGKTISDTGLEDDCKSHNLTYLLIEFNLNLPIYFNDSDYSAYYNFMGENRFYIGLCLFSECEEFYKYFCNPESNSKFYNKMNEKGLTDLKIFKMKSQSTKDYESENIKIVIIIFYIFIFYILFRIAITFLGYVFYEKDVDDLRIDQFQDNSQSLANSQAFDFDISTGKGIFYRIYKIFSFRKCFKLLLSLKNKYYDDTNLEFLSGIRFYLIFLIILNQIIYGISRLPHRDFGGYNFYISFSYIIIKYASYSTECLISLNGIYFGFKLMSYLKKSSDYSFKSFLKFYFNFVSRTLVVLISFLLFHLFIKEVGYLLGSLTIFDYFVENYISNQYCFQNPWIILIPFYMQYVCPTKDYGNENCFKFISFISSELYCFTIILFLTYLLTKLKSKLIDKLILAINVCHFILIFLYYDLNDNSNYSFFKLFGENRTINSPHIFIITYFFGFNIGVIYFYYNDILYDGVVERNYQPYYYNFEIMKFLDQRSNIIKYSLIIISFVGKIIISFNFYLMIKITNYGSPSEGLYNIKENIFTNIIFVYQNKIFVLFFNLFVISFLILVKDSVFRNLNSSSVFIPLNRISFVIFCLQDSIVYIFFAINDIQIYMNLQNCLFITLGLLGVILIISLLLNILFEMPLRMIYKRIVSKKSKIRIK